jgi:hypothetical protein
VPWPCRSSHGRPPTSCIGWCSGWVRRARASPEWLAVGRGLLVALDEKRFVLANDSHAGNGNAQLNLKCRGSDG